MTGRAPTEPLLPRGTVTLVLGDVEGSTRAWEIEEPTQQLEATRRLDGLVATAACAHGGVRPVEQGEGDSFVVAFDRPLAAVDFALHLQKAILDEAWPGRRPRVRIAVHSGEIELRGEGNYAGPAINRCARLRALAHGGQVLVSQATAELLDGRLPDGARLRDLGVHQLPDVERPHRVHQLCHPQLPPDFPPLRSSSGVAHNCPPSLTSFVGRERESSRLADLLRSERRLITIVGAGGTGKTRLAAHVTADIASRFPGGVWWVDLAPLADSGGVAASIAAAVGLRMQSESLVDALVEALGDVRGLVVLDNCEHVLDTCAELIGELLSDCAQLTVLATSREPLGLEGEISFPVPPLDREAAVELFVERARQVRPDFETDEQSAAVVQTICDQLDGMPLAIELAAARVRMLSLARIRDGLADRFRLLTGGGRTALPRQRTLEASVDWSYRLLNSEERVLYSRLAVFAGGFELDAAEAVGAGGPVTADAVVDVLTGLVDKSLVQADTRGRYSMLETIRAFARERLADSGEAAEVRERHLDHYTRVLREMSRDLVGANLATFVSELRSEIDNVRAAIDWAVETGAAGRAVRIMSYCREFLRGPGLNRELRERLDAVLASDIPRPVRAEALFNRSQILTLTEPIDIPAAHEAALDALAIARECDRPRLVLAILAWLPNVSYVVGEGIASIEAQTVEAEELARGSGDRASAARVLVWRGQAQLYHRGPEVALPVLVDALDQSVGRGFVEAAYSQIILAQALRLAGRYAEATERANSAMELARYGQTEFVEFPLLELAAIELHQGAIDAARRKLDWVVESSDRAGRPFGLMARGWHPLIAYAAGDLGVARAEMQNFIARCEVRGAQSYLPDARWRLALVCRAGGDHEVATEAVNEVLATTSSAHFPFARGRAAWVDASINLDREEVIAAEARIHESIELLAAWGDRPGMCDVLETLAAVLERLQEPREATRFLGAAARLREELGQPRFAVDEPMYRSLVTKLRDSLRAEFERSWAEGLGLQLDEAVAYARRGRGERRRPTHGWDSLSPTELDVAALVAGGHSNPEIAKKLFISRNTVKAHLSHIYGKLGINGRAELAAEFTRRGTCR